MKARVACPRCSDRADVERRERATTSVRRRARASETRSTTARPDYGTDLFVMLKPYARVVTYERTRPEDPRVRAPLPEQT
jgi:hypothetical protein